MNNFQRVGAISNAHAGRDFEEAARLFLAGTGIALRPNFVAPVGYKIKKSHKFDLGSEDPPILVECKSYTWTSGGNSPSAKIRGMNEVMLLFSVAPEHYRKILFVLRHLRKNISLATHYIKNQGHLVGPNVEIWEFDLDAKQAQRLSAMPISSKHDSPLDLTQKWPDLRACRRVSWCAGRSDSPYPEQPQAIRRFAETP